MCGIILKEAVQKASLSTILIANLIHGHVAFTSCILPRRRSKTSCGEEKNKAKQL